MEPDDAADLLAEMPPEQRERLLAAMETVEAGDLRRLLRYDATTAGGLMTSQPADRPARHARWPRCWPRSAIPRWPRPRPRRFTCASRPRSRPTGRYLGTVGFQRLLRQPPGASVSECIEESTFIRPDLTEKEVARRMAAYNLIGVAVCDENGRLLGAVTVDDVLDRILPPGWRKGEAT